jgi:hypothetical protein
LVLAIKVESVSANLADRLRFRGRCSGRKVLFHGSPVRNANEDFIKEARETIRSRLCSRKAAPEFWTSTI